MDNPVDRDFDSYWLARACDAVNAELRDRGIAVRPAASFPGLHSGHLRVTARDPEANARLATALAIGVVLIELWAIAWIRARYMDTKFLRAAFEVVVGGLIVFAAGVLIGSA